MCMHYSTIKLDELVRFTSFSGVVLSLKSTLSRWPPAENLQLLWSTGNRNTNKKKNRNRGLMLSPIGISVSMCLAMHMHCLLWPMRRLRRQLHHRQPGTHTLCEPVCDNLLFSLLHCSLLSPSISSSSPPIIPSCVPSAGPYQPVHYRLCSAQFACKFRFRDWFYIWSFKDFSGRYFIHFGWPTASSRPTFWSPSLPPRLQTSVSFYWFWRLAASVCTDKEQKMCVCVCCIPTAHVQQQESL